MKSQIIFTLDDYTLMTECARRAKEIANSTELKIYLEQIYNILTDESED